MPATFLGMTIYVAIAALIGLLVLTFVRWRNLPAAPVRERAGSRPSGAGCGVVLTILVLAIVAILVWMWLSMGARP